MAEGQGHLPRWTGQLESEASDPNLISRSSTNARKKRNTMTSLTAAQRKRKSTNLT